MNILLKFFCCIFLNFNFFLAVKVIYFTVPIQLREWIVRKIWIMKTVAKFQMQSFKTLDANKEQMKNLISFNALIEWTRPRFCLRLPQCQQKSQGRPQTTIKFSITTQPTSFVEKGTFPIKTLRISTISLVKKNANWNTTSLSQCHNWEFIWKQTSLLNSVTL